ncbi:MAG TPA: hypothetical protein VKR82_08050 [Candidatus Acidoferrales bacterium]|nr:hypothetical protein [Candidatus Acidoferrales bacterium]
MRSIIYNLKTVPEFLTKVLSVSTGRTGIVAIEEKVMEAEQPVFSVTRETFDEVITPLIRYGFLEAPDPSRLPLNDPATWERIAIACTEYLTGAGRKLWGTATFHESVGIVALKLTAEAAIAWRATAVPEPKSKKRPN